MKLEWLPREQPLRVEGCWADGEAAKLLRRRLGERPSVGLRVAFTKEGGLAVLGPEPPWVDGAIFLGREDGLYLPTLWRPSVPVAWIVPRLRQLGEPPWALLPPGQVVGLSAASVLT